MYKKEQLIANFRNLYNKMVWLNNFKMMDRFEGYTSSEVHCIEHIGSNAGSNVTKLAQNFYMTRGAISKMTKKLIKKGAIESYQKSDNKKEIFFNLTPEGWAIYKIHEELHNEFSERDKAVFDRITDEQFDSMFGFIEMYSRHLDVEIKKLNIKPE